MNYKYDIFVSYKSENANAARTVVDCLLGNHIRVWFAEYKVLLYNYEQFKEEICKGIDSSHYALVFTNNRWSESEHCRNEIERILLWMDHERVLEVCIPNEAKPHRYWPQLRDSKSMNWRGSVEDVIKFIDRYTSLDLSLADVPLPPNEYVLRNSLFSMRFGTSLNLCGLKQDEPSPWNLMERRIKFPGEAYFFRGDISLQSASVPLRLLVHINPLRTVLDDPSIQEEGAVDDRQIYNQYRTVAKYWIDQEVYKELGLHLFFWQRRSNQVLTYAEQNLEGWHRRYILILREKEGQTTGEIALDFGVKFSGEDFEENFAKFCMLTRFFDAIASSLVYTSDWMEYAIEKVKFASASLISCLIAFSVFDYVKTLYTKPVARCLTAGFLGAFVANFMGAIFSPKVRRGILLLGIKFGSKLRILPTLGRFLDQMWDLWLGGILWTSSSVFRSFAVFLGALAFGLIIGISEPLYWGLAGVLIYVAGIKHMRMGLETSERGKS